MLFIVYNKNAGDQIKSELNTSETIGLIEPNRTHLELVGSISLFGFECREAHTALTPGWRCSCSSVADGWTGGRSPLQ